MVWSKQSKQRQAQIRLGGKSKHLGTFEGEKKAAHAYDAEVRKHSTHPQAFNFPAEGEASAEGKAKKRHDELLRAAAACRLPGAVELFVPAGPRRERGAGRPFVVGVRDAVLRLLPRDGGHEHAGAQQHVGMK